MEDRPHDFDVARFGKSSEGNLMNGGDGAREVGANHEAVKITENEQRRIFLGVTISYKLIVGGGKDFELSLVLPAKEAAFPHVGKAITPAVLGHALLKAKLLSSRISGGRCRMIKDGAKV